ncbi:MAG: DUF5671 domain-containing protein [bacterium]
MNKELVDFVRDSLKSGSSKSEIDKALSKAGWETDERKEAISRYLDSDFPVPVPKKKSSLSARESFLYLLMFLTLYLSANSFGTILFQLINYYLPDAATYYWQSDQITSNLRLSVSFLVVAGPVFLWVSHYLSKTRAKHPEIRSSGVRKFLTYLTLLFGAGVIIGDFITVIFNFLNGEITTRFILKALVVLVIAASIFGYYLWDLKQEERDV